MPIWSHFPTPSASRPRKTSSQDRERERVRKSVTDFPLSRHWQLLYSKCCNASGLSAIYRLYLSISLYIHPSVSLSFYLQSSISNYPSIRYLWFSTGMCVCRDGVGLTFSPGVSIMQSAPTQLGVLLLLQAIEQWNPVLDTATSCRQTNKTFIYSHWKM